MSANEKGDYGYSSETDRLVEFNKNSPRKKQRSCWCYGSVVLMLLLGVVIVLGIGVGVGVSVRSESRELPSKITISNLMKHLNALQEIANNDPKKSRAVQYGYNESAEMVYKELEDAGYEVTRQHFTVATYEEASENSSSLAATISSGGMDFTFDFLRNSQYSVMRYSDTTDGFEIEGNLSTLQASCSAGNYTAGTVALIDYVINETIAGCSLLEMAEAASEGGALALIMMRREEDENNAYPPTARVYSQDGDIFKVAPLPVLGATYALGSQLMDFIDLSDTGTVTMMLSTDTIVNYWETYNVLAYTKDHMEKDATIVFGSHLDSVPAGPGINDNGSGSAANLEIALQLADSGVVPHNRVLFAFWGAEELGLLGSTHYVASLTDGERAEIALNLNFDMIASPNYVRQIYNGSGAENENIIYASGKIQSLFEDFFNSKDLSYALKEFNGRSDYGPFIAEGIDIPAGGLATGADETKSEEDRATYGGIANAILDPCYHQSCDTVDNIHQEVYLDMSQAAAYVLNELMMMENLRDYLKE